MNIKINTVEISASSKQHRLSKDTKELGCHPKMDQNINNPNLPIHKDLSSANPNGKLQKSKYTKTLIQTLNDAENPDGQNLVTNPTIEQSGFDLPTKR